MCGVIPNWLLGSIPLIQSNIWTHHIFILILRLWGISRVECWRFSDVSANIVISTFRVGVFAVRVRAHCSRLPLFLVPRLVWSPEQTVTCSTHSGPGVSGGATCAPLTAKASPQRGQTPVLSFRRGNRRYGGTCYFHFQGVPGKDTFHSSSHNCHSLEMSILPLSSSHLWRQTGVLLIRALSNLYISSHWLGPCSFRLHPLSLGHMTILVTVVKSVSGLTLLNHEDGRNVGIRPQNYIVLQPRRPLKL